MTDDSIMTLAVARAIIEAAKTKAPNEQFTDHIDSDLLANMTVQSMKEIGRQYPKFTRLGYAR